MANFAPLKRHMLGCLDRYVGRYRLSSPFLEVGCGRGDVSEHLARKGWRGLAIDFSEDAVTHARARLAGWPNVEVRRAALDEVGGQWRTVLMWDVLEHIEDDADALRHVARLLEEGGVLILAVPSNPREWRWDDDFYGHVRRYTVEGLGARLREAGLAPLAFEDFTFPVYWAMRRAYTRLKRPQRAQAGAEAATRASALQSAWTLPGVSSVLDRTAPLWWPVNRLQHALFRNATARGHELFALARKPGS